MDLGRCHACGRLFNKAGSRGKPRRFCSSSCRAGAKNERKRLMEQGQKTRDYVTYLESGIEDAPYPFEEQPQEQAPAGSKDVGLFGRIGRYLGFS